MWHNNVIMWSVARMNAIILKRSILVLPPCTDQSKTTVQCTFTASPRSPKNSINKHISLKSYDYAHLLFACSTVSTLNVVKKVFFIRIWPNLLTRQKCSVCYCFGLHLVSCWLISDIRRIRVKSAPSQVGPGQLGQVNSASACMGSQVWGKGG